MELKNGKYVITIDDVVKNSELTDVELTEVFGDKVKFFLQSLSEKTYRVMYGAYRGIHRERQRAWMNWFIQQSEDRQVGIREAIIEYIRGAIYSGMDMQVYVGDKKAHSEEVINILKENGLWVLSTVEYLDEELVES